MASRRRFSQAFKRQVVEEFLAGSVTQAQLASCNPRFSGIFFGRHIPIIGVADFNGVWHEYRK